MADINHDISDGIEKGEVNHHLSMWLVVRTDPFCGPGPAAGDRVKLPSRLVRNKGSGEGLPSKLEQLHWQKKLSLSSVGAWLKIVFLKIGAEKRPQLVNDLPH